MHARIMQLLVIDGHLSYRSLGRPDDVTLRTSTTTANGSRAFSFRDMTGPFEQVVKSCLSVSTSISIGRVYAEAIFSLHYMIMSLYYCAAAWAIAEVVCFTLQRLDPTQHKDRLPKQQPVYRAALWKDVLLALDQDNATDRFLDTLTGSAVPKRGHVEARLAGEQVEQFPRVIPQMSWAEASQSTFSAPTSTQSEQTLSGIISFTRQSPTWRNEETGASRVATTQAMLPPRRQSL